MIKRYKNYLLGVIGILLTLTMFIGIKYIMQSKYEELPEVKLRDINNKKSFAIMIQKDDGYEEYEGDTWPSEDENYIYTFKEAKCTDNNGALVENAITYNNGKVSLKTNKTIYCTLYFDEKPIPEIVKQLKAKDKEVSNGIEHLSEQGGMYRYQGTDDVPNWIIFGTREKCEKDEEEKCTNSKLNNMTYDEYVDKYMYRIIGITKEGEMYLLKETFLKEGETNTFKWHNTSSISECIGDKCEWPNVDLYKRLNGETSNGSPIFVDNSYYEYMTKDGDWYNLIEDHNWMYGDTSEIIYNGEAMYGIETGKTATKRWWPDEGTQTTCSSDNQCTEKDYTWSKRTDATKIGLMYMHDVDYAYTGGNPGSYTNVAKSWIFHQKDGYNTSSNYEWLTTRFGVDGTSDTRVKARGVNYLGSLLGYALYEANGARPVFYLSSKAKIASGDGTKSSPFILSLN